MELECDECKQKFQYEKPARGGWMPGRRSFCSAVCRRRFEQRAYYQKFHFQALVERPCVVCSKPFTPRRNRKAKTCSAECNLVRQTGKQRIVHAPRDCEACGISFVPKFKPDAKTCSATCSMARVESIRRAQRELLRPKQGKCSICGTEYEITKHGSRKYCSVSCRQKVYVARSKQYQKSWVSRNRDKVLAYHHKNRWGGNWLKAVERDSWTCQICKSTDRAQIMVHHLDGEGERRAAHHELENLQTVCKPCHRVLHQNTTVLRINGELRVRIGDKQYKVIEEKP